MDNFAFIESLTLCGWWPVSRNSLHWKRPTLKFFNLFVDKQKFSKPCFSVLNLSLLVKIMEIDIVLILDICSYQELRALKGWFGQFEVWWNLFISSTSVFWEHIFLTKLLRSSPEIWYMGVLLLRSNSSEEIALTSHNKDQDLIIGSRKTCIESVH